MILSPGILASGFEMLDILNRREMSFQELRLTFPRVGVCRTSDALDSAQNLSWERAGIDGLAELTQSGVRILSMPSHEERLRQAVLDYIDAFQPAWVQNASFGRHKVLSYVGLEVKQVFSEAGLTSGTDEMTVAFWDMLAGRARGQKDDRLAAIGRRGERLTIRTETFRTGKEPKWVALDNNADGYDVLSIVGPENGAHLSIEVKSSTQGLRGSFHITRTEWERAVESPCHCFHLWMLRGAADADSLLAVIQSDEMKLHVPVNAGKGEWSSFEVPFEAFKELFQATMFSSSPAAA